MQCCCPGEISLAPCIACTVVAGVCGIVDLDKRPRMSAGEAQQVLFHQGPAPWNKMGGFDKHGWACSQVPTGEGQHDIGRCIICMIA